MIVDFQCTNEKCGVVSRDNYYPTYAHLPKDLRCKKCNFLMKKLLGTPFIGRSGPVPGYEKENQGHLTLGKAIDSRNAW